MDDRRIYDRAGANFDPFGVQMIVDRVQHRSTQLMCFNQMAEFADRGLVRHSFAPRSMPTKRRIEIDSYRASSVAGSERLNQCCKKYSRSIRSSPTGGRPRPG